MSTEVDVLIFHLLYGKQRGRPPKSRGRIQTHLIHKSRLQSVEINKRTAHSVRYQGQVYDAIVRRCSCPLIPVPHYEMVDGHTRLFGSKDCLDCKILELTDLEALELMGTTEHKGHKSAWWWVENIGKRVEIEEKQHGKYGAIRRVAKTIPAKNLKTAETIVSQLNIIYTTLKSYESLIKIRVLLTRKELLTLAYFLGRQDLDPWAQAHFIEELESITEKQKIKEYIAKLSAPEEIKTTPPSEPEPVEEVLETPEEIPKPETFPMAEDILTDKDSWNKDVTKKHLPKKKKVKKPKKMTQTAALCKIPSALRAIAKMFEDDKCLYGCVYCQAKTRCEKTKQFFNDIGIIPA